MTHILLNFRLPSISDYRLRLKTCEKTQHLVGFAECALGKCPTTTPMDELCWSVRALLGLLIEFSALFRSINASKTD